MEHMQFKKKGKNVTIYPLAKIVFPENISIGDETVIDDFVFLYGQGKGIKIGNFCHITVHCTVQSGGLIEIGDFSGIGPGSIILAMSDDYRGGGFIGLKLFGDKYRNVSCEDVTLGRHVHVGAGSIILPGVTIGDGCSVGAGSLVTRDLPEWTICYGSPCKPIKDKPKEKQLRMEKEFLEEYYKGRLRTIQ
ncbi:dTDP-4-amino-4,6-dideoxy-D-glucose acyltransferase [subsurface metagenome]